ncbi:helix-turn-helix domain-containing protein [Vagococcus martis]|uniref:helix-turn-helix domain-containing protein n=1 Tax=Vagococcus martis TaxID=1768210 RepID=UPI002FCE0605
MGILLKEQKINQRQLAIKMDVHPSIITDLKKGIIKKPSFELMCKIAYASSIKIILSSYYSDIKQHFLFLLIIYIYFSLQCDYITYEFSSSKFERR